MVRIALKNLLNVTFILSSMVGCSRDETNYYPDREAAGLSIFSDNSNNVMSCYIDGKPWRTHSRVISLFSRWPYEVYIIKDKTNSALDSLAIQWTGHYAGDENKTGYISLTLPVAKNFTRKDFSAFKGKRINVTINNGFFTTSIAGLNLSNTKGSGTVYFHSAQIDSVAPGVYSGTLSGLFEADFNSFKIVKGRFDHEITPQQINL